MRRWKLARKLSRAAGSPAREDDLCHVFWKSQQRHGGKGRTHENLVVDALEACESLLRVVCGGAFLLSAGPANQASPLLKRVCEHSTRGEKSIKRAYKVHGRKRQSGMVVWIWGVPGSLLTGRRAVGRRFIGSRSTTTLISMPFMISAATTGYTSCSKHHAQTRRDSFMLPMHLR